MSPKLKKGKVNEGTEKGGTGYITCYTPTTAG